MEKWSWLLFHNFLKTLKQATAGLSEPSDPYLLLSGPRHSTNSSQPRSTAWLCLGISKYSTSSSHLRLLYSSGKGALGQNTGGGDLGQNHPGNPRACVPRGQLHTMLEHHHTATAQLIFHGGWRLVVSGYSQSLQMTSLDKSLPITCQQQPRLNYKRRMYSANMKGVPQVPSLGDRGGCSIGPYRISHTLDHANKSGSHSSST